jgi:hypothetical protein
MTRKRYIKLMMAEGWDRNTATSFAEQAREDGKSYAADYALHNMARNLLNSDTLRDAMGRVVEVVGRMCNAICAGVAAFSKAYTEAMSAGGKEVSDT